MIRGVISSALDVIYPSICVHCGDLLGGKHAMCDSCFEGARRITEGYCDVCGEDFDGEFSENPICPNCHDLRFSFEYAKSALKNTTKNRELVISFKYGKQHYLARVLAKFCGEVILNDPRFSELPDPVVVPVPLHWRRQFSRGFNQSELICRELTRQTGISRLKLLKRVRYSLMMSLLLAQPQRNALNY